MSPEALFGCWILGRWRYLALVWPTQGTLVSHLPGIWTHCLQSLGELSSLGGEGVGGSTPWLHANLWSTRIPPPQVTLNPFPRNCFQTTFARSYRLWLKEVGCFEPKGRTVMFPAANFNWLGFPNLESIICGISSSPKLGIISRPGLLWNEITNT